MAGSFLLTWVNRWCTLLVMAQKLGYIYEPYKETLSQEEIVNSIVDEINDSQKVLNKLIGTEYMLYSGFVRGLTKALQLAQGIERVEEEDNEPDPPIDPREDNTRGY